MAVNQPLAFFCVASVVVLYELEENLQFSSTIRLIENAICQRYYSPTRPTHLPVDEAMCKIEPIQQHLAVVRGFYSAFANLPILLLGSWYSTLADKRGRRIILFTAISGMVLNLIWVYLVCIFWNRILPELVWLTFFFRLIGGGPFVVIALYVTIVSDLSTDETRSQMLYKTFCFKLAVDLVGPQIASESMKHSLWLPYLLSIVFLLLTLPIILLMPETLNLHRAQAEQNDNMPAPLRIYRRLLVKHEIGLSLVVVFIVQLRYNVVQILPTFMSVKFGWNLSKTAGFLSILPGVSLVIYLILPLLTDFLHNRRHVPVPYINIWILRSSCIALLLGTAFMSIAPSLGSFILAIVLFSGGFNIRAPLLAATSYYIDISSECAHLYTLISMVDTVAHILGGLAIEGIWAEAIDLGGKWLVLQYVVLTVCFFIATILALCLPVIESAKIKTSTLDVHEQEQSLLEDQD